MRVSPFVQRNVRYDLWRHGSVKGGLCALLFFWGFTLAAQGTKSGDSVIVDKLPVPNEPKQLFYLQRDPDENTVIYQVNTVDGVLDADEPVNVYWIRYAEGGTRKNLNFVQRTMAYGISHKALGNGDFELRLAAYKSHPLRLSYCEQSEKYKVYATINDREAVLDRIFVRIEGGSMFSPDITYFELSGRDTATQARITERIKPNQ